MRELALYARRTRGSSEFAEVLDGLFAGGAYERRTALHLAMAAQDLPFLERVLTGEDLGLRRAALRAVRTLPVSPGAVSMVLIDAPTSLRKAYYRALDHGRRTALADRLLSRVRSTFGDREAAFLLPACSAAVVGEQLPSLAHAVVSWNALSRRHPVAVLDVLEAELADSEPHRWWHQRRMVLIELAIEFPERVLGMLEHASLRYRWRWLPERTIKTLARFDAVRTASLAGPRVQKSLHSMLLDVAPSQRDAAFDAWLTQDGPNRSWLNWILPALPLLSADRAAREARRLLDWHASVWHSPRARLDDPDIPLRLTSFLPWNEATAMLTDAAFGGDPRRRALARRLLLECAARTGDRELMAAQFDAVARRVTNDADPLRGAFFEAVAELPLRVLDDAWAGRLASVAAAAVNARDTSPATCHALRGLAVRLLRHRDGALAEWALEVPGLLVQRFGAAEIGGGWAGAAGSRREVRRGLRGGVKAGQSAPGWRFDLALPAGWEQRLVSRVPLADGAVVVALARGLGRRAWGVAELQEALGRVAGAAIPEEHAQEGSAFPIVAAATELWLADPATRVERALRLVDSDPAKLALPPVWRAIAGRRPDILADLAVTECWLPQVTPQLPGRWTPALRDRVADFAASVVDDSARPVQARANAVRAFGLVARTSSGDTDRLVGWSHSPDAPVAEVALGELGRAAAPQVALASLLDFGNGPYSAAATAALATAADFAPPSVLGPCLTEALAASGTKVTVRKTAVRLLRRHGIPRHLDVLLDEWARPTLHPDVRIAIAVQLRGAYEDPRAVAALGAAERSELMIRTLYQPPPSEYPAAARPAYAELVYRLLRDSTEPGIRFRGSKAFAVWARWYAGGLGEIVATLHHGGAEDRAWACDVVGSLVGAGVLHDEVPGILARLAAEPDRRADAAELASVLVALQERDTGRDPRRERMSRAALAILTEAELLRPEAVRLAIALIPARDHVPNDIVPSVVAERLHTVADLLADRPYLAGVLGDTLVRRFTSGRMSMSRGLLQAARLGAEELAARDEPVSGLLAARLAGSAAYLRAFAEEWGSVVEALRDSRHVEVRQAAAELAGR